MVDEIPHNLFQELTVLLQQNQLGWIAEQVREEIYLGKPEIVDVKTLKETSQSHQLKLINDEQFQFGPPAKYVKIREYTPKEQLQLLVETIIKFLTDIPAMYNQTITYFSDQAQINYIEFDGIENIDEKFIIKDFTSFDGIETLKSLLNELQKEINKDDH